MKDPFSNLNGLSKFMATVTIHSNCDDNSWHVQGQPWLFVVNYLYSSLVPSQAPTKLEAYVLDSTSVRISWGEVPTDHHNGIIIGYRIFYKRGVNGTYKNKTTVPPAETLVLYNLDKAAVYNGTVLAFTETGDGKKAYFTFKTHDDSKWLINFSCLSSFFSCHRHVNDKANQRSEAYLHGSCPPATSLSITFKIAASRNSPKIVF